MTNGNHILNIEQLADQHGLSLCVQCGKCVAVCPMGEVFDDFTYRVSPRGVVEATLLGLEITEDDRLWFCLTCDECTEKCPQGVRFRDFVEAMRRLAIAAGHTEYGSFCEDCGGYVRSLHTVEYVGQKLGEGSEAHLRLCPVCRQRQFSAKVKSLVPGNRRVEGCCLCIIR